MSGNGTYVDVTEGHVDEASAGYVGGHNILVDKYNQTFSMGEEMRSQMSEYLETMICMNRNLTRHSGVV